jgi:RecB family endonuclease NucS
VELKRGRPSDRVVGQVARYMGWVRTHLATTEQAVEGLIVAHDSDDALRYAVSAIPGLRLMTYEVKFELIAVEAPGGPRRSPGRGRLRVNADPAVREEVRETL